MVFVIIAIASVLAGFVQGVTGFGTGLILMTILPLYFPLPVSAGTSVAIAMVLCASMCIRYRKDLNLKKALIPAAWTLVCISVSVHFAAIANPDILKKAFGVFLIVLSVYYLFFNKYDPNRKMSLPMMIFCITVSGICDGLFGIGGPLMVLYFLQGTRSTREYLGTLQFFFLVSAVYGTAFRTWQGILGPSNFLYIAAGWVGILFGVFIANRIVDRINANLLRKLVYILIGISGISQLIR